MIRTYKRKLKLTIQQEQRIDSWIGCCRYVYNMGLEIRIDAYNKLGKSVHKYELQKQLKDIKLDYQWVNDVPRMSLEIAIDRLDEAYRKFFSTCNSGGGFPKFRSKRKFNSISFKDGLFVDGSKVKIPKIGWVRTFNDQPVLGEIRTATIKREISGYYITIHCKDVPVKFISENQAIGLDMGITKFCTDSNGLMIENPRHFKKYERQLRIENRSLARKIKGSNSYSNQIRKLRLLHGKISNVRKDFLHKESTKIAKVNNIVYMEKLNVSGMVKSTLAKSISDAGWSTFRRMLEYKTQVVVVNPAYTSQQCNECKAIDKKSRISQSEYVCTSCGYVSHADVNGAKNIRDRGTVIDRERSRLLQA